MSNRKKVLTSPNENLVSAGKNVLRVVNKKAAATGLEKCTLWMEKVTNRLEGCGERDEEKKRMVERDPDPEALEMEERIAEAEPTPAPSWMDEDCKRFNLRIFQEWENQRANWRLRHAEEDPLLDSSQGDVISQQKDPEVGIEEMKRREIFLKAGKEIGRRTLTKETEEAPLQDTRQGDVLSHKKEQNCGGEKNKRI